MRQYQREFLEELQFLQELTTFCMVCLDKASVNPFWCASGNEM
jgi:hypothetical protein